MRTCTACGEAKPDDGFYKSRVSRDGLTLECRQCLCLRGKAARAKLKARSDEEIEVAAVARGPKLCRRCGSVKGPSEFPLDRAAAHGRRSHCAACLLVVSKSYWDSLGLEERRRRRSDKDTNRRIHWEWRLKTVFGITVDEYNQMLERQNGLCAICRNPETAVRSGRVLPLSVDHDHETGVVRALLCGNCNAGLGQFKDSPELLTLAALYVSTHKAKQASPTP